jgi:hypothetical protein
MLCHCGGRTAQPPHRHQRGERRGEGKHERIPVTRERFARLPRKLIELT